MGTLFLHQGKVLREVFNELIAVAVWARITLWYCARTDTRCFSYFLPTGFWSFLYLLTSGLRKHCAIVEDDSFMVLETSA